MTAHTRRRLVGGTAGLCVAWLWLVTTGCLGCPTGKEEVEKHFKNMTEIGTTGVYLASYASSNRSVLIKPKNLELEPIYVAGKGLSWNVIPKTDYQFIPAPTGWTFTSEGQCLQQGPLGPAAGTGSAKSQRLESATGAQPALTSPQYAPPSQPLLYKAGANTNVVVVLDPSTNTIVGTIPVGTHPRGLAGTPDGKQVWVTNKDSSSISVIATATLTVAATIQLPTSQPYGIAITPDGTTAYVASGQVPGAVYVVDVAKQSFTTTITVGGRPFKLAVSPDGGQVYVTNNADGTVSVIDVLTNTVIKTIAVGAAAFGVAFQPNGTRVYVTANGDLVAIDPVSYQILATVAVGTYPVSVTVDETGTEAFVCNRLSTFISHVDLTTNQVIENIELGFSPETATLVAVP